MASKIINNVSDDLGNGWFTEQMAQNLLNKISTSVAKRVREERYSIQEGAAVKLKNLINELLSCYRDEKNQISKIANKSGFYTSQGWSEFIYQKKEIVTYEKIFKICSEILDILRTGRLDKPLQLVVYTKNNENGLDIYYGEESKANIQVSNDNERIQYIKNETSLKLKKLSENNILVQHYKNFKNGISSNSHLLEIYEKRKEGKINEGHIIEAFQRHLYWQHKIHSIDENTFYDPSLTENPIPPKHIAINLYYAVNNDAWWTGGDVGMMQVKGDNLKLASIKSINAVATKILEMITHYKTFSAKDFKKMFTQEELDRMTRYDPEHVGNKTIKELASIIASKSKNLKDV